MIAWLRKKNCKCLLCDDDFALVLCAIIMLCLVMAITSTVSW